MNMNMNIAIPHRMSADIMFVNPHTMFFECVFLNDWITIVNDDDYDYDDDDDDDDDDNNNNNKCN
jgi:hypothetical protein